MAASFFRRLTASGERCRFFFWSSTRGARPQQLQELRARLLAGLFSGLALALALALLLSLGTWAWIAHKRQQLRQERAQLVPAQAQLERVRAQAELERPPRWKDRQQSQVQLPISLAMRQTLEDLRQHPGRLLPWSASEAGSAEAEAQAAPSGSSEPQLSPSSANSGEAQLGSGPAASSEGGAVELPASAPRRESQP